MTYEEFAKGMTLFSCIFDIEYKPERLGAMYEFLKGIDGPVFFTAISNVCKSHPTLYPNSNPIAIIRDAVFDLEGEIPITEDAWLMYLDGKYTDEIREVLDIWEGNHSWCYNDNPPKFRAEFMRYYENISRERRKEHLEMIGGKLDLKKIT